VRGPREAAPPERWRIFGPPGMNVGDPSFRVGESAAHDGNRTAVRATAICAHLAGHAKDPSRGGGAEAGHVWPADP